MPQTGTAKRLWALDAPTLTLDSSILMVGASGEVTVPMPAYLIEHPKGLVLFDTSIVPAAFEDPRSVYGDLADFLHMSGTADQRLDRQLPQLGYQLGDVSHLVLSHTHFDHSGGLSMFPDAKFYVGEGDMRFGFWPDPAGAAFFRQPDLEATRNFNWFEIPGRDVDLFGDGSVIILWTPGHTPGELSLLVRLPGRNFVLTGDTVHLRAAMDTLAPMPYDADTVESVRSIHRLRILRDTADATVWISHDPEDWAAFSHAPACYE